jgi:hypothetical protein
MAEAVKAFQGSHEALIFDALVLLVRPGGRSA